MQISFDPTQRTIPSLSTQEVRRTSQGIANNPSSIEFQLRANESSGGFCAWIQSIINRICQFFGISSSNASVGRSDQHELDHRVFQAKEIISEHFQNNRVHQASPNDVIIVVLKYNGQSDISYGRASEQRNNQDVINALARQLLEREHHTTIWNGNLKIDTIVLNWDSNSYFHASNLRTFAGLQGGTANGLITTHARPLFDRIIASQADHNRLMSFLSNWNAFRV